MQLDVWLAYVLAMIVISISPGSGCINTLSTSLSYGFRQALPAIAGLQLGLVVQLIVVGVGLGAILASSELAFMVLQWAGVGYLVWIGGSKLIWPEVQSVVTAIFGVSGHFCRDRYGGDVELRVACPRTEAMAQLGGLNEAAGTVFWVIIRGRRKPVGALLSGEFTTPAREVG